MQPDMTAVCEPQTNLPEKGPMLKFVLYNKLVAHRALRQLGPQCTDAEFLLKNVRRVSI